jgi:hypothetical protein
MEPIRRLAFESIARGSAFAVLAIVVTMIGVSFDAVLALKVGAFGFTLLAAVLMLWAERAPVRDPRRTEVWSSLPKDHRPPVAIAQKVIGHATRDAAAQIGLYASSAAITFWLVEIAVLLLQRA